MNNVNIFLKETVKVDRSSKRYLWHFSH